MQQPPKRSLENAFRSLTRYRLLLPIIIAALITILAISYMNGGVLRRQQERFNTSIVYSTEAFISYATNELTEIVLAASTSQGDAAQAFLNTQQGIHEYFNTVYLISDKGRIEALAPLDERYLNFDMTRQDYYRSIDCSVEKNISNTFTSLRTGLPTVYISQCTENGYIVVGELNLSSLQETTLTGMEAFPAIKVLVVDENGSLIAHPDFTKVELKENISQWEVVEEGFKSTHTTNYYWRDGTFWFGTTEKVALVGWLIITETSFITLYGPSIGASIAMLVFLILIFSVAVQRFSKQIQEQVVRPLQYLSEVTDAVALGEYSKASTIPRSAYALNEVQHLSLNFQNMSRAISSREKLLRESEKQYRGLVENSPDAIIVHNQYQIVYLNDAARQLYRVVNDEQVIGNPLLEVIHPLSQPMAASRLKSIYNAQQSTVLPLVEQKHLRLDGSIFDAETITSAIFFGGSYQAQTIVRDISRRKHEEERLKYLASHDHLSELPNRFFFEEVLQRTLAKIKRTKTSGAILYLDIDQFKAINDSYGHAIGDAVIKKVAEKLRATLREEDIIARIGGDEFIILLDAIQNPASAAQTAEAILYAFSEPFEFEEIRLTISFSIGIAIFPRDGINAAELLQFADAAMYKAKDEGKNRAKFYSIDMRKQTEERVQIISYLQYACEKDEFFLTYQPQYDVDENRCVGVEVLLRWNHPKLGILSPGRFIDFAEETGLILPIGEWVLKTACKQIREWDAIAPDDFHIAVNFSNLQLKQPNLLDHIEKTLRNSPMSSPRLEIELVENIVFQNPEEALERLFKLKALGIKLAIDDFGTGYSMLGYLAHFPFDHLKIDQRIAPNIINDPKEAAIVSGIISISHELGLKVIAEGIETKAQLDFYRSLGCQYFQGWYFSREVDAATVTQMLIAQQNA